MKAVRLTVSVWAEVPDAVPPGDVTVAGKVFVIWPGGEAVAAQMHETDAAEEPELD